MRRFALIPPAVIALGILAAALMGRSRGLAGQPPICDAGGPYAGLLGYPVEFDGTASTDPDGIIVAYDWDFGDGASGSGPTPSHTYAHSGSFTATLTVTDDTQLTSTCSALVVVAVDNMPPICDAGGPYTGAVGQAIQFDGTRSTGVPPHVLVAYEWDFGDGGTGTGPTPTHVYPAGVFTVTLVVTDDNAQMSACTTEASVAPLPVDHSTWGAIKARGAGK